MTTPKQPRTGKGYRGGPVKSKPPAMPPLREAQLRAALAEAMTATFGLASDGISTALRRAVADHAVASLAIEAQARPAGARSEQGIVPPGIDPDTGMRWSRDNDPFLQSNRPAVASEGLRAALRRLANLADDGNCWCRAWENGNVHTSACLSVRAALASDAGSVGALDVERLARALHEAKIGCWGPEPIHDGVPDAIGQTEVSCTVRWNGTTPSSHEYEARAIVAAYLIEPAMTALSATRAATTPDDAERQGES